jgi:hypothetical protein
MGSQIVSIALSPEITTLLAENSLDLLTQLKKEGLDVSRTSRPDWLPHPDPGSKSVELIILAAAAAAPMVAIAIGRIIDAVARSKRKAAHISSKTGHAPSSKKTGEESTHKTKVSFLGLKVELVDTYKERP